MADIIVKSYKSGSYSKYGSMLQNAQQQVAARAAVNRGGPVAPGVPGADPNEIAKQLLASRNPGAVAAVPTAALPGQGLGMLQGYNQPGPLGTSLASSQLGTLPGGVTGAGRSVGEAGPMKMAAKNPARLGRGVGGAISAIPASGVAFLSENVGRPVERAITGNSGFRTKAHCC
jgi:hypothetical protein